MITTGVDAAAVLEPQVGHHRVERLRQQQAPGFGQGAHGQGFEALGGQPDLQHVPEAGFVLHQEYAFERHGRNPAARERI
jgi:hypothetical protein